MAVRRNANARGTKARFQGISLRVGSEGNDAPKTKRLASSVVRRVLGKGWRIREVCGADGEYFVERHGGTRVPPSRAWSLARKLQKEADVANAEPAFVVSGLEPEASEALGGRSTRSGGGGAPIAPCARENCRWSLEQIRYEAAQSAPIAPHGKRGGEGIVVAHPDTGYTRHFEIWSSPNRVLSRLGRDFEDDRRDPRDPLTGRNSGHGTRTASVIMSDDNGQSSEPRVSGVAPRATLIPYRVSDSVVHFSFSNLARSIHAAVDAGAHVVSMSLGGVFSSGQLERAIDRAIREGLILLAAAGNVWPWVVYPAKYDEVIAVAAVDCRRKPWDSSASGAAVDLSAPGADVWSARSRSDTSSGYVVETSSGTSYAVATTAGACAVWLAHHGRARLILRYGAQHLAAVFREILIRHGVRRPRVWDTENFGAGILDLDALLRAPLPDRVPAASSRRVRGLRTERPRAFLESPFDRVAEYLPGVDRGGLYAALAEILRTADADLPAALDALGEELLFHVATNPILRESLSAAAGQVERVTSGSRSTVTRRTAGSSTACKSAAAILRRDGSRDLRARVGSTRPASARRK